MEQGAGRGEKRVRRRRKFICNIVFWQARAAKMNASELRSWLIDSGANVIVVQRDDHEVVVRVLLNHPPIPLRTCGDESVQAHRAWIRTPIGVRWGLVVDSSPRILPMWAVAKGGDFRWKGETPRAWYKGKRLPVSLDDGIPVIQAHVGQEFAGCAAPKEVPLTASAVIDPPVGVAVAGSVDREPDGEPVQGPTESRAQAVKVEDPLHSLVFDQLMPLADDMVSVSSADEHATGAAPACIMSGHSAHESGESKLGSPCLEQGRRPSAQTFEEKEKVPIFDVAGNSPLVAPYVCVAQCSMRELYPHIPLSHFRSGHRPARTDCPFCTAGKLTFPPHYRMEATEEADPIVAGEKLLADLCGPWPNAIHDENTLLVMVDAGSGAHFFDAVAEQEACSGQGGNFACQAASQVPTPDQRRVGPAMLDLAHRSRRRVPCSYCH